MSLSLFKMTKSAKMSKRSAAVTFLPLSVVIVLGLSGAVEAQTNDVDISTSEEQNEEQKLPVSTLCGTEEFAAQWKIFDYRSDQDSADLIALGKTSPKDIPLIVAQLRAPFWLHRQAAAKALGVIGKRDPAVIDALQTIVDRGLPLLKGIRPEAGLSKELMEKAAFSRHRYGRGGANGCIRCHRCLCLVGEAWQYEASDGTRNGQKLGCSGSGV